MLITCMLAELFESADAFFGERELPQRDASDPVEYVCNGETSDDTFCILYSTRPLWFAVVNLAIVLYGQRIIKTIPGEKVYDKTQPKGFR